MLTLNFIDSRKRIYIWHSIGRSSQIIWNTLQWIMYDTGIIEIWYFYARQHRNKHYKHDIWTRSPSVHMHAKRFIIGIGGACSKFSSNKIHSFNKIISVLLKYILIALLYVPMTLPNCISWYMQVHVNSSQFIVIEDSSYVSNKMNRANVVCSTWKYQGRRNVWAPLKNVGIFRPNYGSCLTTWQK